MDKTVIRLLRTIRDEYGNKLFDEPDGKRLRGYLADSDEGRYGSEINCLLMAFKDGVYNDLKGMKTLTLADMQKYISKFDKQHFWKEDITRFAVNTWAEFVGIKPLPDTSEAGMNEVKQSNAVHSKPNNVSSLNSTLDIHSSSTSLPSPGQNKPTPNVRTSKVSTPSKPNNQPKGPTLKETETYLYSLSTKEIYIEKCLTEETCNNNSRDWFGYAKTLSNKEHKQMCYQISILEMAKLIHISDIRYTDISEYLSKFRIIESVYQTATKGLDKVNVRAFQSVLDESGLRHYIPLRYRNSTSRVYSSIGLVLSFLLSLLANTFGVEYMKEIPIIIANQIVLVPYLLSAACMAYLIWSFNPDIVTGLTFKVNRAITVVILGVYIMVSIFLQQQVMRLILAFIG